MKTYSYYPGCTLKNNGAILDRYARESAKVLGFQLEELDQWQCCGGVYPMNHDKIAPRLPSVRALAAAEKAGRPLVTLCSACYNVLKQVNRDMAENGDIREAANRYMGQEEAYFGAAKVAHFLEILRDEIGFDNLKTMVRNPLNGKKIGAFYGCLLLRPGKVLQLDDPENPKLLEDFIRALGGEPVVYGLRNECCGGYLTLKDADTAETISGKAMENAAKCGAEVLITACPLCQYNLNRARVAEETKLPVLYFTELLAEALGVKENA